MIYVHREHHFTNDEIEWMEHFAAKVTYAIRHAIAYTQVRDFARQQTALHTVVQDLIKSPQDTKLLDRIAWTTLNLLVADVVTIYEYIEADKKVLPLENIAGRLKGEPAMHQELDDQDTPVLLIRHEKSIYAPQAEKNRIMNNPNRRAGKGERFIVRENIKSSAGILLRVGREIVGVMFINYRRPHIFPKREKEIIDTLALHAATAIQNQRWMRTFSDVLYDIGSVLDAGEVLKRIVIGAVRIADADVGYLRLLKHPSSRALIVRAKHPAEAPVDETLMVTEIGEGVTGWVVEHGKPALVSDVKTDSRYRPFFSNMRSELCVPLVAASQRVVGALNVESRRVEAFNVRGQIMLEALAKEAVIAIQNAENRDRLIKTQTMAALGDLAGQLCHNAFVGKIDGLREATKDILLSIANQQQEDIMQAAEGMLETLDRLSPIVDRLRTLKDSIVEEPRSVDLRCLVLDVFQEWQMPPGVRKNDPNLSKKLPMVVAGKQLAWVLNNLIQNALDAMMPKGGLLTLSASAHEDPDWVKLSVKDTGMGIPDDDVGKIFEIDFTTKQTEGSLHGFGLWWTRTYVERLGGRITVDSEEGKGTRVTVILPAEKAVAKH